MRIIATTVFWMSTAFGLVCPASCLAQRILATLPGAAAGSSFGSAVAALEDLDGDGVDDYAVGAGGAFGAPYVELRSGRDHRLLSGFAGPANEQWGSSISAIGDVTGEGVPDFLVGVPGRTFDYGALVIYSGTTGLLHATIAETSGRALLGKRVLGVDDVDADGTRDFVATAPAVRQLRVYSGRTRAVIRNFGFGQDSIVLTTSIAMYADLNGDGVREILAGDPLANRIAIFDIRTGATLRIVAGNGIYPGFAVAGLGDLDRDGVPDFAAGAPGSSDLAGRFSTGAVFLYSGQSGALLRAVYGTRPGGKFGASLARLSDLDGDGVSDFAVGSDEFIVSQQAPGPGQLAFVSGAAGSILMRMEGLDAQGRFGAAIAGLGDVDGDGLREVLVGAPNEARGQVAQGVARVISGRVVAQAVLEGTGCGGGPFIPLLGSTRPIAGTTASLAGEWAPMVPGSLLLSAPPPQPTSLGFPGCDAWIDLASAVVLAPVPPSTGRWSLPMPVPGLPGFIGLELSMQVVYGPTLGVLGFDVTNGLRWRIGW